LSGKVADLRWGCIFYGKDGSKFFSVYFDKSGRAGVVNGACFDFGSKALADWAESSFKTAFN
jgi:hypothetical protein